MWRGDAARAGARGTRRQKTKNPTQRCGEKLILHSVIINAVIRRHTLYIPLHNAVGIQRSMRGCCRSRPTTCFMKTLLCTFLLPTLCPRFAYAVAVSAYAGLLCLHLPTRADAYRLIFDFAYTACIWCFCGVCVFVLSFHVLPTQVSAGMDT